MLIFLGHQRSVVVESVLEVRKFIYKLLFLITFFNWRRYRPIANAFVDPVFVYKLAFGPIVVHTALLLVRRLYVLLVLRFVIFIGLVIF